MAKNTKQQQQRALKKRKERLEKRRLLRHTHQQPSLGAMEPLVIQPTIAGNAEQALRSNIQKFAFQPSFLSGFEKAVTAYFGSDALYDQTFALDQPEGADFQEWYFFDFAHSNGKRIIDLFAAQVGPALPADQQAILDDWRRTNRLRLLEVQAVNSGVGETVLDLVSGELLHCKDISMSHSVRRWMIVLGRPLLTAGRWHFTGSGFTLSPLEKDKMVAYAREQWESYQHKHPGATVADFYRDHSLQLRDFAIELVETKQNPLYLTPERHRLMTATAHYRVRDFTAVIAQLDESEEFVYAGDSMETPGADHYNWLLRGRSHVPEASEDVKREALMLRTEWTLGPGEPSYRSLGDLTVTPHVLELACLSRERLAAGKSLLAMILGDAIKHQQDRFEEFSQTQDKHEQAPSQNRNVLVSAEGIQVQRELMAREMAQWLDTPMPKLGDRSPRAAAQSEDGRATLAEVLKIMEYLEADRNQPEDFPYGVRSIRRELGLAE